MRAGCVPWTLEQYLRDIEGARCSLIVAGWAMDNMKPLDFLWSEQPVFPLSEEDEGQAAASVEAAEQAGFAVAACVGDGVGDGSLTIGCRSACARGVFCRDARPVRRDARIDVGGQALRSR